ncbi:hypothetical protein ACIBG8_23745 [Nonomuraea sp. NPDC050556]|uniref:hypothetical protein n=1 Tax=Nonomuraea sp. NPDC050556 TaxID=3364369 RepID=UPI0037B8A658
MADPDKQQALRDAESKEQLARKFDGWAGQLDGFLKGVTISKGGREIWTGPAADRFKTGLTTQDGAIKTLASDCRSAAENLRKSARQLRDAVK